MAAPAEWHLLGSDAKYARAAVRMLGVLTLDDSGSQKGDIPMFVTGVWSGSAWEDVPRLVGTRIVKASLTWPAESPAAFRRLLEPVAQLFADARKQQRGTVTAHAVLRNKRPYFSRFSLSDTVAAPLVHPVLTLYSQIWVPEELETALHVLALMRKKIRGIGYA